MKIPLLLFILIIIFFYKIFLGLIPLPSDLIVGGYYPWLDYKWGNQVGVPVKNSANITDAVSIFYPLRSFATNLIKQGQIPLWNPLMFGGSPLIASQPVGLYFPTILFYLIFSTPIAWTLQIVFQVIFACLFMFFLARHLGLNKLPSFFSAIAYGFGGFCLIWLEWNSQATASAFLPLLILLEDKLIKTKKIKWGIALSFCLALQIFAGFFPVTIFSILAMIVWFLFKASFNLAFKLAVFIGAGFTLSSILLIPSFELYKSSQRLYEIITPANAFLPFQYLVTVLAPDFFGNPATENFWGPADHLNVALYTGIVAFILAVVGIFTKGRQKEIYILLTLLILTLIITTNNPLAKILYNLGLWGGSSMTMSRSLFLINFCVGLLAGISLNKLSYQLAKKYFLISLFFVFLLIVLAAGTFNLKTAYPYLVISFRNLILPIIFTSVFSAIFFIWQYFKINKTYIQISLIILLTIELFRFGWKYNPFTPVKYLYPETAITNFLKQQTNTRFVSEETTLPANMWVPYNLQSVAGYDSFYPLNIAKIIATANSNDLNSSPQTKNGIINKFSSPLLDITGTNFIVAVKRDKDRNIKPEGEIDSNLESIRFNKVFEYGSVAILENKNALPRAYQTSMVISLPDKESLKKLIDKDFLPKYVTISSDITLNENGEILKDPTYKEISNDHIQVKTNASINSMLVVLDNYYPGWQATVDSTPTQIHKVNYAFRGVLIPAGVHTVDFYYRPESLKIGAIISLLSGIILLFTLWAAGLGVGPR